MLTEHLTGEPTSFTVIPFNDQNPVQIKLTARNRNEKRDWAQHIKQVMLAHFDIPSRAKELVFQLGDEEGERDRNLSARFFFMMWRFPVYGIRWCSC